MKIGRWSLVVGRWSLVVASLTLLTLAANAKAFDLKLKCSGTNSYKDKEFETSGSKNFNFYLTFSKNMKELEGAFATCKAVEKNDDFYFCSDKRFRIQMMRLDRRTLEYIENTRVESSRDKVKAKCEIASEPRI
ncbi:hypothetical protein NBRC116592_03720 [Colwellia sp. KU-HH00111]|uniref:hypothetical protein n=1 Tax=Colwellia sp. KU-HH00111 TaxID=3127652 RepID=UPI00310AB45D